MTENQRAGPGNASPANRPLKANDNRKLSMKTAVSKKEHEIWKKYD